MAEGTRGRDDWTLETPTFETGKSGSGDSGKPDNPVTDTGFIDPKAARAESGSSTGTEGTGTGKKRGRPFGSQNRRKTETTAPHDPQAVARYYGFIVGLHATLALREPLMAIEDAEAQALAKAIADVLAYYPTVRQYLEGKAAAHAALIIVCLQVYGTRLVAIGAKVKARKAEEAAQNAPGNVFPFGTQPQFHA